MRKEEEDPTATKDSDVSLAYKRSVRNLFLVLKPRDITFLV
jgi:hypothetical protein